MVNLLFLVNEYSHFSKFGLFLHALENNEMNETVKSQQALSPFVSPVLSRQSLRGQLFVEEN